MQRARKAEEIVMLLRKVEILINQGKTVLLSCKDAVYQIIRTISGVENMEAWMYHRLKN